MDMLKLNTIKLNPNNPRKISPQNLKKLMDSLSEFSKMLFLRPIVIDENNIILGGNQRFLALKTLSKLKILPEALDCLKRGFLRAEWVIKADDLSEDEKRRFIIADNIPFGEWDLQELAKWDNAELSRWGLDDLEIWEKEEEKEELKKVKIDKVESKCLTCPHCGEILEL